MNWKHILKEQPENGRIIIQIRKAHGIQNSKYFEIRMSEYHSHYDLKNPFHMQEMLEGCDRAGCPRPDYYWIYSEDFPFPETEGFFLNKPDDSEMKDISLEEFEEDMLKICE